ncbi:MAG: DJ-1/PfpI family protein [Candidatus Obscuribacterales bacterium]|nr:DJ-1/PfpI family protein [Candidatus Obscuribacterales bacterium]
MSAKRILMLVGDFVEDYEAMVPYQILIMAGHDVHTICPGKKPGDSVKTAIHDFDGAQTYSEKPGHNFAVTHAFEDTNETTYDALIIPGGRAPEYLRLNGRVIDIVKHFFEAKKPVAAICHGPQILAAADVLKGRSCTAYFAIRPEMENAGANWVNPGINLTMAHTDGNLVTAVAWPGHPEWMRQFLALLGTEIRT